MIKLSVLRWIYNLGWRQAEQSYYYALKDQVDRIESELDGRMAFGSDKSRDDYISKLKRRRSDLLIIIEDVFKPFVPEDNNTPVQPQLRDRFRP